MGFHNWATVISTLKSQYMIRVTVAHFTIALMGLNLWVNTPSLFLRRASKPTISSPAHLLSICFSLKSPARHFACFTPPRKAPESRSSSAEVGKEGMGDVVDLTGDGGVIKTIVRHAKADALAPTDNLPLVDVHYEGILEETGEVFDTTHEDNSIFSFEIGKGTVIKAWDIALRTMKVGEMAKITCKPDYAYGSAGSPPDIPPNATLIFEVELVACRPRKGSTLGSASEEKARLEELRKQRELAAAVKEDEKKKREEAKAAAAARLQAKMDAKKGHGKGKGKAK